MSTDPEATATIVNVASTMPERDQTTIGAYRQSLVERLFSGMLNDRFEELSHTPNPPFLAAADVLESCSSVHRKRPR